MIKRRSFLKSLPSLAALVFAPTWAKAAPTTISAGWLNAFRDKSGRYGVAHISPTLDVTPLVFSPHRLHALSVNPNGQDFIAPARRPDSTLIIYNIPKKQHKAILAAPNRHYYGHGVFSADGRYFYVPENDLDQERGLIGLYDARQNYRKIAEYPSGGIGPHEVLIDPTSGSLIVANGGILTHPNTGRAKLNLDTMAPNITWLNPHTGHIQHQDQLPPALHRLSLRHMDVTAQGMVFVGAQDQQKNRLDVPLVWQLSRQNPIRPLATPPEGWGQFKGYVGSVCAGGQGHVSVSSPRGNIVQNWRHNHPANPVHLPDVCGLAPFGSQHSFLMTTGQGWLLTSQGLKKHHPTYQFDNHCRSILGSSA